jgi:Flp pilus assembly protein TadG
MANILTERLRTCLGRFAREQDGSVTIEAVMWLPFFMFLLVLVADASFIFNGQARALRIVQDGNRAFSVGRLEDPASTQTYIAASLADLSPGAVVSTTLNGGIITSVATIPLNDLVALGGVPVLRNFNITVRSQHFLEF